MNRKRRISPYNNSDAVYKHYNKLAELIVLNHSGVTPEEVGDKLFQATQPQTAIGTTKASEIREVKAAREWLELKAAEVQTGSGGVPEASEIRDVPRERLASAVSAVACATCGAPIGVDSLWYTSIVDGRTHCENCSSEVIRREGTL